MPDSPHPASSPRFELFASTAPGLESIAAGELNTLGQRGLQEIGGVGFGGDLDRLYEANLWLRTASRVVVRLGRFHANTFYELERRARKLPWEEFLPASGPVRFRVTCRKSRLYHSDAVAERMLSAISRSASRSIEVSGEGINDGRSDADHAEEAEHADETENGEIESGIEGHPAQLFIVRIVHDQVEVSADSSGELLHRRGYRQEIAKAPLRETLAAAMVLASGWRTGEPLLDPMCGSGTIPIEAALIARGVAPGLQRKFQFMNWPSFDQALWNDILEKARSSVSASSQRIRGSDRDAGAIHAAARNAERAGVADMTQFSVEAISESLGEIDDVANGVGWILTNPPYGIRIGESDDLRNLYARLGTALRAKRGWRVGILTSDSALVRQTRLPLVPRFDTRNGGIPV
ncbi:MAG TPA: class I SAM-dependent RNA methyltransferase, partial [Gemmatimonadaceae bacterium]|nr:class I SAM-dependent RNA methyltransferase [Gemmatimonadaceae bacterium]